jgi:hypothetical protein
MTPTIPPIAACESPDEDEDEDEDETKGDDVILITMAE